MDFSLNDEQKMMIDTVRRFIAEQLKPLEDEIENSGFLAKDKAQAVHDKARRSASDYLIRRAFGNVYGPLLHCKGEQVQRDSPRRDRQDGDEKRRCTVRCESLT